MEALTLLNHVQQVALEYNEDIDLHSDFDYNDALVIKENDSQLYYSVFLRYLPLPLIKYFLERPQE